MRSVGVRFLVSLAFVSFIAALPGTARAEDESSDLPPPPSNDGAQWNPVPTPLKPTASDEGPAAEPPPATPPVPEPPSVPADAPSIDEPPPADTVAAGDGPPPTPKADAPTPQAIPAPQSEEVVRLERAAGCYAVWDGCWPGCSQSCYQVVLEGAFTVFEDMEGLLGEPRVGSLSWNGNSYDGEFGGRITVRRRLTDVDQVEVRGALYREGFAQTDHTGGVLGFSPPAASMFAIRNATLTNRSDLASFEVNWWRVLAQQGNVRWRGAVGLRYLNLEEDASARLQRDVVLSLVNSNVDTDFIALQLGADVSWLPSIPGLQLGLGAKVLLGSMSRDITVNDDTVFLAGPHTASNDDTVFGFGTEIEFSLVQRVTPNVAATASFSLLFLNDVVRANDAMDFSQANTGFVQARQDASSILIHSLFFGVQIDV